MDQTRKISVIMGVYNCADYISEAIESIINQTYTNWELIICDDCSNDNTYQIAKSYADKYKNKIILIRNDKNSYLSYSLNHCLKYATGYYVARMDGDDISVPERFEKEVKFLVDNPDVDMVGSEMQHFNEDGLADIVRVPYKPDKYILKKRQPFMHATIMTYKRVYDALGGYKVSELTRRSQDLELWFRFYDKGFVADNIHEPLYLMRENMNAVKRRTFKVRWNAFKIEMNGYKLLKFPKMWLIKPFFVMILKSLVPSKVQYMHRKYQQNRYMKENNE